MSGINLSVAECGCFAIRRNATWIVVRPCDAHPGPKLPLTKIEELSIKVAADYAREDPSIVTESLFVSDGKTMKATDCICDELREEHLTGHVPGCPHFS